MVFVGTGSPRSADPSELAAQYTEHSGKMAQVAGSLAEALRGEVDPKTLEVQGEVEGEKLRILISYRLATLGHAEQQRFVLGAGGVGG